jgi:1-deoxy-D-xylulose-5-phosphate synthase
MVAAAEEAAALLLPEGIELTVWDVRVVSDPDPLMVADAGRHGLVVTAEDGVRQGGAGMFLADAVRASCPRGAAPPVMSLGIPRTYLAQGKPDRILARLGLDGPGLARSVRDALGVEDETHGEVPAVATPPRAATRRAPTGTPAPARPASARSSEPRD